MDPALLDPFVRAPTESGLFVDFDGTLSHIVQRPAEARPVPGAREVLARLAAMFKVVAVVSGRAAADLVEWLGPDLEIWGVHGAERSLGGRVRLAERVEPYLDLMARVKQDAERELARLGLEGVILEDKRVMVALHFRDASDVDAARRALDRIVDDLAGRHGLTRAGGRLAFELRPPQEFSKALVVLERARAEGLRAVAFVGDDRVDLPGFDALDKLAAEGVATLRVAVDSAEAPAELLARADVVVDGPGGAIALLEQLLSGAEAGAQA